MNPFDDASISRRAFVRLSAATGAALSLPGNATAEVSSETFDPEYEYVVNHVPADWGVPTLATFSEAAGLDAFATVADDPVTTTEPRPAAYAQLTSEQAAAAADLPAADRFQFSPGSNPFWRLGYYPLGVFPEPRRSVDFVGFEQLKDGLRELEDRYPEVINVRRIGQSPGHRNNATDRDDPKGMYVAEVTNDATDAESFAAKEKVFYSCSLHGLERAGAEAGARIVENILRGDDHAGALPRLLDDVVLLFGFTNPDGWAVRNPQYDSGWQTGGPGASHPRVPAAPVYERGNAEVFDTNRQYPTVGYITPLHYPGEPRAPADRSVERVPDALAIVEHFRNYENLNYGADLHGGPIFADFTLGLISQDQFDTRDLHELYAMMATIDEHLEAAQETWVTMAEAIDPLTDQVNPDPLGFGGVLPESAFDYATIYDTIGYTVTGAMLDWMSHPEDLGGLGMTTLDFEMSFSHVTGGNVYNPEFIEMEVTGYREAIRTIAEFAVANSDTPTTDDEFSATTETGGERVAYVTTGAVGTEEDALRRRSGTLDFDGDGELDGPPANFARTAQTTAVDAESTATASTVVTGTDLHSLHVAPHAHAADGLPLLDLELVSPAGEVVRSFDAVTETRAGGKCCGLPEWDVAEPDPGEWTVRARNLGAPVDALSVEFGTLQSTARNPDPVPTLGYEQYAYDVTPFRFFEDYADSIADGGGFEPVTVADVAGGALLADDGSPAYDHVVAVHDYGANAGADYVGEGGTFGYQPPSSPTAGYAEPGYVGALDDFVDAGGNLVLTDMGVNLLGSLSNDIVDGSGVSTETVYQEVARFTSKDRSHPLLTDVRPIQNQLWKVTPLGYSNGGEAPVRVLTGFEDAAAGAVASVAGRIDGSVAAGSIADDSGTGVHVVASLLPPATQKNLHPFGLLDYTPSFLGYLVFTSALGFQQVRETADGVTRFGRGDEWGLSDAFTVSATRQGDDGSAFTAGQTYHATVDVTADGAREVRDRVPDGWEVVDANRGEVRTVDGTTYVVADATDGAGTVDYFAEAPESTGQYTFGPAGARPADVDEWTDAQGSTADVAVVGVDQNAAGL